MVFFFSFLPFIQFKLMCILWHLFQSQQVNYTKGSFLIKVEMKIMTPGDAYLH